MDRRIDVAISAIFVFFGLFVIAEATTIKAGLYTDPIGPRAFFYGCGAIFVAGGLFNIAQRLRGWRASPGHMVPMEGVADEEGHPASFGRAATIAGLSLAYTLTLVPLGFLIATPLYILACLRVLRQRNWLFNAALALGFTLFFYVVFAQGLGVWLPVGPFTTLFRDLGWIIL
ncbi:tripartite tricarboxylate transporter TctB family protein [Antarcticirhabdus aurantiaca]|uniref:Tripartite tricarboxylate transporter TctB family protein n=1 Tax=Antarcticirhabdus aurantiaca TaxID=2606717 RepID=A0ACD4NN30_9HYPH|nr:tripartite tricarboxylate transporter TctB family protein [Antarcticirhabdus aurantiaca]WAJ28051.1 tripartite tricarboxylate transporter TctB family protein [Jeongeuplla avenae]